MSRFVSYLWWLLSKYLYRDLNRSSASYTIDAVITPLTICAVLAIGTAFQIYPVSTTKAAIAVCTVDAVGTVIATHKRLRQLCYIFFIISEEITTPLIPVLINPIFTFLDHRYLFPSACDGFQIVFLLLLGLL